MEDLPKIECIKLLRGALDIGLVEAKGILEAALNIATPFTNTLTPYQLAELIRCVNFLRGNGVNNKACDSNIAEHVAYLFGRERVKLQKLLIKEDYVVLEELPTEMVEYVGYFHFLKEGEQK